VVSITETTFDAVALRGDWRENIRTVGTMGYDGVELALRDPGHLDANDVGQLVRHAGLAVAAIGTGQAYQQEGLTLTSEDPGIRRRAIERIERHLTFAAPFGAPVILGLICGRLLGGRSSTDVRLIDSLEQLLPRAERAGVRLLVEPINRYETDYLMRMEQVLTLIDRLNTPSLGVLADTFHMNIEEASIEQTLRRSARHLGHVHVADSNRQAPGWGHLDFEQILRVLTEIGYRGYLSAEIVPYPDPVSAAAQAVRHLGTLLAQMGYSRQAQRQG